MKQFYWPVVEGLSGIGEKELCRLRAVARASALAWRDECRRISADRAAKGGKPLAELWNEYEVLTALGGGSFDPNSPRPDEDELVDAINAELVARMSLDECAACELDRLLKNRTRGVLEAFQASNSTEMLN